LACHPGRSPAERGHRPAKSVASIARATASQLYEDHFGFRPLYVRDRYVHLQSTDDPSVNLALVAKDHPTESAERAALYADEARPG
jgi:hypothetical protein